MSIKKEETGKRLQKVRDILGFTQAEICKGTGISQSKYSKYEQGILNISLEFLTFIQKLHKVSAFWLLSGEGEMFVDSKKIIQGDGNNVNIQTDNRESTVINGESNSTSGQDCASLLEKKDIEIAALQKQMELLQGQIDLLHNQIKDKDNIIRLLQM